MHADTEHLRNVLKMQREWIRHWRVDARHNLSPTLGSLAEAEEAITAALQRTNQEAAA